MHRLLFSFIFVLSFFSIQAQPVISNDEVKELTQRVDSLEHELAYMRLSYELYSLNSDITIFANEVYTKSVALQLDIYHRNLDSRLGDAYLQYYESCQNKKDSFSELIEAKKIFFAVKIFTYSYTETELGTLFASYNIINHAFDSLEKSMNTLKIAIDLYRELM